MIYVMTDIHGCYTEFQKMLKKIDFSDEDELFLLGDLVDRGPEPIRLLQDLMLRPNVYPILGNHDYMALSVLAKLNVEITEENAESHLTAEDLTSYLHWAADGGAVTAKQFSKLDREQRREILEYLEEFTFFEEAETGGRRYVLVHAGIHGFEEDKELEEYEYPELIFHRADYGRRYFSDPGRYLVTGHTPTFHIREDGQPLIYEENGHIALDCGCVYGGRLAAYCLDNGQVYYVDSMQEK